MSKSILLRLVPLVMAVGLGLMTLTPALQTLTTPPLKREPFLAAVTQIISVIALTLFSILVLAAQRPPPRLEQPPKTYLPHWFIGFLGAAGLVAGIIIYVDPTGLYETKQYIPMIVPARESKTTAYTQLPGTPDLVILGSSRAFTISPTHIQHTLGYVTFNASVESGRLNDVLVFTRFILDEQNHTLPKVLLIEIGNGFEDNWTHTVTAPPLRWLKYMPPPIMALAVKERLTGIFNLQQLTLAFYALRYQAVYDRPLRSGWEFASDGLGSLNPIPTQAALQQSINDHINRKILRCTKLTPEGIRMANQLLQLADEHGSSLVFYNPPAHPQWDAAVRGNHPDYLKCIAPFKKYIQAFDAEHDNVFFLDFSRLDSFNGLETLEGFHDAQHLTSLNNNRLIDAAAETLQAAFQVATQRREPN